MASPYIVVYGGHGVSCPVCGRSVMQFAHLADGSVMAHHVMVSKGKRREKVCVIQ